MRKSHRTVVVGVVVMICAACSPPDGHEAPVSTVAPPAVNEQNCKRGYIETLDPSIRTKFADACFRRGAFRPSAGQSY